MYHAARVEAARRRTNVTSVVRGYLELFARGEVPLERAGGEDGRVKSERDELVGLFRDARLVLGYAPNRETTHGR